VVVWLPALLVASVVSLPLLYLFVRAAEAGVGPTVDLLLRPRTIQVVVNSLVLAVVVSAVSVALALVLGWLTARTDLPGRRVWAVLTTLPLVLPSYIVGFLVVAALGPRGMLQQALEGPFGVQRLPEVYGLPGAALVIVLVTYPLALLVIRAALRGLDPAVEEASRSLGYGPWKTFFRITVPQLRPAIAASVLLVALYALSDFGAVSLLRHETFTWAIYLQYQSSFNRALAASLSLVLVALAGVVFVAEVLVRGRARHARTAAGVARPHRPVPLGPWKWPAIALCSAVVGVALVMPAGVLAYWLVRGLAAGETLNEVWGPALSSISVSGAAAVVAALAALPVAVLAIRYPGRVSAVLERMTYVGYALPGIAVALALVFFATRLAYPLYQTHAILVLAYVVLFLPLALGPIRASLVQVSPRVEEAARTLGRTPFGVLRTVTAPLVRSGVLAGAALVFLTTMKELPATLLLSPLDFKTLAASVWSASSEAFFARAALPALLLILASSIPMALLAARERDDQRT
jgi:iron(III) transport system permease protein